MSGRQHAVDKRWGVVLRTDQEHLLVAEHSVKGVAENDRIYVKSYRKGVSIRSIRVLFELPLQKVPPRGFRRPLN